MTDQGRYRDLSSVAGKILDRDLGVRDARAAQSLDIACAMATARLVQVFDSP